MIYTKKGDKGRTTLVGGRPVSKADDAVEVYGTIDELNAQIGFANTFVLASEAKSQVQCDGKTSVSNSITTIQNKLFLTGNLYASPADNFTLPFITEADVTELEQLIDAMEKSLPPLRDFILPGGTPAAAALHVARTVCRRLERLLVRFTEQRASERKNLSEQDCLALKYINRLSDYLFVAARTLNVVSAL
ncbi:MAG: cob(I)yrinic acid a,c-diamide adenosyltransferase [Bacteroidales bacterium]|jgi:cob(I)alamin adenosyltransferase|nr:cob(I)yrinic acid a,c-diamide adenosyltransferase [Bacteroidales bacterium]